MLTLPLVRRSSSVNSGWMMGFDSDCPGRLDEQLFSLFLQCYFMKTK